MSGPGATLAFLLPCLLALAADLALEANGRYARLDLRCVRLLPDSVADAWQRCFTVAVYAALALWIAHNGLFGDPYLPELCLIQATIQAVRRLLALRTAA